MITHGVCKRTNLRGWRYERSRTRWRFPSSMLGFGIGGSARIEGVGGGGRRRRKRR
ncbi:unnamed protein product [Spirodela intermedia]|uniref:Uncharacterized protein n=1 Tax=Spirodela intermedia TaxID=51605 RepID=A0A7I8IG02_SPIIN|nr:unnamed protein product [Spirodela intermedia]CAA6656003.1 unnamed protein product [Spirodela intermedia]